MINILRQSFNRINIYERHNGSLWWNGDNQLNLKLSIRTESADVSTRVSEKARRTTAPLNSPIFFYHFHPTSQALVISFPRLLQFLPWLQSPDLPTVGTGARDGCCSLSDSESKIPIQAGVSDERRHAALCLQRSRQLTEFSGLPRLPVTQRWQNPAQLPLRKEVSVRPLEQEEEDGDNTRIQNAQGVVEKGRVLVEIRIPELTQVRI